MDFADLRARRSACLHLDAGIEWSGARSGLPRSLVALAVFAVFLMLASVIGYFGIPPFMRAMTHVFNDFETIIRAFAQRMIGDGKIALLGQLMSAQELAQAVFYVGKSTEPPFLTVVFQMGRPRIVSNGRRRQNATRRGG
jgi:hypothetical protein